MVPNQGKQPGFSSFEQMHEAGINIVQNIASIVCMPVELILRPWHGTRYFNVTTRFCSAVGMMLLPAFAAMTTSVVGMIPLVHIPQPRGIFGIGTFSLIYFLLVIAHNYRLFQRMMHPERELHSEFEGPPLPVFGLLPHSQNFWVVRILYEPAAILLASTVLKDFFIIQPGLATLLRLMALCLFASCALTWYRSWEYIRRILDAKNAGPVIARLVENTATQDELAPIHLASFPKNIDPDIRRAAAAHIARIYSPENPTA